MTPTRAVAVAHSNIALAKYWGKQSESENLPAVPSLSLTLAALSTKTSVCFDDALPADVVVLGGEEQSGRPRERVLTLLDKVRALAGVQSPARVESENDFPTASGLASSASGFAALALAATSAAGLELSPTAISALARESSASAARSLFGGYAVLAAGARSAEPLFPGAHFDLRMLVALVTRAEKATSSSEGMKLTARTSPYYPAWVAEAPRVYEAALDALTRKDLPALGEAMEQSALMMHASMLAARPGLLYFAPATLGLIARVRELRSAGVPAYFTIDAGPHVKVLTLPERAREVARVLREVSGVVDVLIERSGARRLAFAMKAQAPGKLVLSGAYAVLSGAPAIVTAVDRYALADTSRTAERTTPEVAEALEGKSAPWFDASALRQGEHKLGLGSSAAILVASLAARELESEPSAPHAELAERVFPSALAAHQKAQGGGSGVDVAASAFGGTLCFRRGDVMNEIEPLTLPDELVIEAWWSGTPASTPALLARVADLGKLLPDVHRGLIDAQAAGAVAAANALRERDIKALFSALHVQLDVLSALGTLARAPIVTEAATRLAKQASAEGGAALPAGAGGGDVLVFFGPQPSSRRFGRIAVECKHERLELRVGARGVHGVG